MLALKKRNEFIFAKAELKKSANFPNVLISEDLTQLRYKLLNYVKNKCDDRFAMCHSYNGRIRMKEAAIDNSRISSKKEGKGNLIVISSTDDLFKLGIDFKELVYQPLFINQSDVSN